MSRYIEIAHQSFPASVALTTLAQIAGSETSPSSVVQDDGSPVAVVPRVNAQELMTFVVKLRNATTRMWGDQIEVRAMSAADAAEDLAGEHLVEGGGERADLRVSVWATPFGSRPCRMFYIPALA